MALLIQNHEPKTYVVLGMHRSGTSFLSGALIQAGANMGDTLAKNVNEETCFQSLNTRILNSAGGSWDSPPSGGSIAAQGEKYSKEILATITRHKGDRWGWKDPRTSLTFDLYEPHLGGDVYLYCCFRRPEKVVESLTRRNGSGPDWRGVTDEYNRRILASIQKFVRL